MAAELHTAPPHDSTTRPDDRNSRAVKAGRPEVKKMSLVTPYFADFGHKVTMESIATFRIESVRFFGHAYNELSYKTTISILWDREI